MQIFHVTAKIEKNYAYCDCQREHYECICIHMKKINQKNNNTQNFDDRKKYWNAMKNEHVNKYLDLL